MDNPCVLDANKTPETSRVTAAAIAWLDEKGFKPVETEVSVARSWVADIAGACMPTPTEAISLKLLPRRRNGQDYREWSSSVPNRLTTVVEVKTSRGDFLRDRKWSSAPVASLMYVAAPADLISASEVPPAWGWIVISSDGVARCKKPAPLHGQSDAQLLSVIHSIAERRDNVTRYARLREVLRNQRATQSADRSSRKLSGLVLAVCDVVQGVKSLDEAISWHLGAAMKVSDWDRKRILARLDEMRQANVRDAAVTEAAP